MNVVIATQRLEISEIRDVRRCEVSPDHFVTVADVVLEGASLPISVDVTELNAVELASALDLDPQAEARETERDLRVFGPESQNSVSNLEPMNNAELRQAANWESIPFPTDMPIIDLDNINEIPF
jgi:hypothetical protein